MPEGMKLSFLAHSGFTVETSSKILVFDYYKDLAGVVEAYRHGPKPLWYFVSHWHEDHFNRHIADASARAAGYIVHKDVPLRGVSAEKFHSMDIYEHLVLEDMTVHTYGSTDEGASFLVETDGCTIFHAGDLNWWHWLGDTEENNREAKKMYDAEMKRLSGRSVDVAFFPVDARLESVQEWGVMGFLDVVKIRECLVPMHYFGSPWEPSVAFQARHDDVPLWIPRKGGDSITLLL